MAYVGIMERERKSHNGRQFEKRVKKFASLFLHGLIGFAAFERVYRCRRIDTYIVLSIHYDSVIIDELRTVAFCVCVCVCVAFSSFLLF